MDADEKAIALFTTRVRQMILQYGKVEEENAKLLELVQERDSRILFLEEQLTKAKMDYNSLKVAKMLEITNGDMESAQKKLSKLIRDVNKCITLVSE